MTADFLADLAGLLEGNLTEFSGVGGQSWDEECAEIGIQKSQLFFFFFQPGNFTQLFLTPPLVGFSWNMAGKEVNIFELQTNMKADSIQTLAKRSLSGAGQFKRLMKEAEIMFRQVKIQEGNNIIIIS